MGSVILLSLTASLNPTLVAATTLMLLMDKPGRLIAGYYLGAMVTSVGLGCLIVFSMSDSSVTSSTENTISPAVDIVLGLGVLWLARRASGGGLERLQQRRKAHKAGHADAKPPFWQRELDKGSARITFLIGAMLTLPGASYIAGLVNIHHLGYSTAATVAVVVGFNLVMLWMQEVPLLAYLLAPDWTPGAVDRAKAYVARNTTKFAVRGLSLVGLFLIVKGIVGLIP